jgi:hypothetical protein
MNRPKQRLDHGGWIFDRFNAGYIEDRMGMPVPATACAGNPGLLLIHRSMPDWDPDLGCQRLELHIAAEEFGRCGSALVANTWAWSMSCGCVWCISIKHHGNAKSPETVFGPGTRVVDVAHDLRGPPGWGGADGRR